MPKNNFTITFHLQQHTPIIHFQSAHLGAGIRATELKPKLDTYLMKQMGGEKAVAQTKSHLLVGKGKAMHVALDYKVTIQTGAIQESFVIDSYMSRRDKGMIERKDMTPLAPSPYFADTKNIKDKDWNKVRKGLMFEELERGSGYQAKVTFFSFHSELLDWIDKHFATFLLLNNFGTRQSKGFGSFSIAHQNVGEIERLYRASGKQVLQTELRDSSIASIFSTITSDYQILKSGRQFGRGKKMASKLKQHYERIYIDGEPIKWERAVIKSEMYAQNPDFSVEEVIEAYDNERYIRALLGLAGQHSYPQPNIPIDDVKIEDNEGSSEAGTKIERFKSPLTFKPIGGKIYLIVGAIPDELYDREFEFYTDNRSPLVMKTPPIKHKLNLYEFVKKNMRNWYPLR